MHSAGLELTKMTYTRLEDNLIRHRGDRLLFFKVPTNLYEYGLGGARTYETDLHQARG